MKTNQTTLALRAGRRRTCTHASVPRGLVIIAVNVDDEARHLARFLAKHRAEVAVVRDANQKLAARPGPAQSKP